MTRSWIAAALILASILHSPRSLYAGGRRRVVAASPPLALVFVNAGPVLDAGTIAWRGGSHRSAVVTRTVALRIGEASREPHGTATVRAFIETFDPRVTIRIDGIALTTAPRVIRRNAPVGVPFTHRIEIDIPVTAADGPLQAPIGWEVTTEGT